MLRKLLDTLKKLEIEHYCITDVKIESIELFFIKKDQDMRRGKDVHNYYITIFEDFDKDTGKVRGAYSTIIFPEMTDDEIIMKLNEAIYSAAFAANPFYELPKGGKEEFVNMQGKINDYTLNEAIMEMSRAMFRHDVNDEVFINSAEIFAEHHIVRIINSEGIDAGYAKYKINGEFVTQCTNLQDVEYYQDFSYNDLDADDLAELVKESLDIVKARALAEKAPASGKYDIILSGKQMNTIFSYYISRSNASYIYPGYSNYKIGDKVQGDDIKGEQINLILKASVPYSSEGVKMIDRELLNEGRLLAVHGSSRFSYYLGVETTGEYQRIEVDNGTVNFNNMKEKPYLHVISFSDFQMDDFTGNFGGEIRLGYLFDGEKLQYVTGGSINGNILEAHKNMVFTVEKYKDAEYEGPYAVKFIDVPVAGE